MKLLLLGTGGFMPNEMAQTACYLLPEAGILLDAGTGLFRMGKYLQTDEIDVYLTHAHGDHTSGLAYLFATQVVREIKHRHATIDQDGIAKAVDKANAFLHSARIHASQATMDFLSQVYKPYQLDWHLLNASEVLPHEGKLASFPVSGGDEVGFRLDWPGHSLAYITDTVAKPDAPYIEQIKGVDVLLHDCNGPDRVGHLMTGIHHSHTTPVAQIAAQAGVGRLILVHSSPIEEWDIREDLETARQIFPNTEVGEDHMEIKF